MSVIKVNGGIITDQMLAGSLRYFKIVGAFAYAVSDGTVTLSSQTAGPSGTTNYFLVGVNKPVPGSLAEHVVSVIMDRCNIVEIGVVGVPGSETAIHIAVESSAFGWINPITGAVDTSLMVAAIAAIGANLTVPTTSGGGVGINTVAPATIARSTTVTITEVPFQLV